MKLKICFMAALCLFFKVHAQPKTPITDLKVGDPVPDVSIPRILNYPGGSARISDFKDKLLILDFWATWCVPCVSHLPEMFAIQNEFRDQVFVLLVSQKKNRDTEAGIKEFLSRRQQYFQFPCVVQDTTLDRLFRHSSIPHFAVIKNNRVIAITDAEHLNAKNVGRLLADNGAQLYLKNDAKVSTSAPLFTAGNGGRMPGAFFRSVLTNHIPSAKSPSGFQRNDKGLITKIYAVNISLENLYLLGYPEYTRFTSSRMIFNAPHLDSLLIDSTTNKKIEFRPFTYEANFPAVSRPKALAYLRQDLERYFQLRVDSQLRDTTCLVLHLNKAYAPRKYREGEKKELNLSEKTPIPKVSHGFRASDLANELEYILKLPVFDETGYIHPVKLDLPADITDIDALAASLKKQGFDLTRETRKVTFMTFDQIQNTP